jgi:hypothetical protein
MDHLTLQSVLHFAPLEVGMIPELWPAAAVITLTVMIGTDASHRPKQDMIVFGDNAGMIINKVKADAVEQFEAVLTTLRSALVNSKDESRRKQAESWRIYRVHEHMDGNVLYIFVMDPAIAGSDYSVTKILLSELPVADAERTIAQFASSIVSINKLTLSGFPRKPGEPALPVPKPAVFAASTDPPLDTSIIRPKCTKEWPDDFAMRAYCEQQQKNSLDALGRRSMTTVDKRTIRTKCAKEWPDDFTMRNYCEEQQLKALAGIK